MAWCLTRWAEGAEQEGDGTGELQGVTGGAGLRWAMETVGGALESSSAQVAYRVSGLLGGSEVVPLQEGRAGGDAHGLWAASWVMGSQVPQPLLVTVGGKVEPFQTASEMGVGSVVGGGIGTRLSRGMGQAM
jgi:hypothetical protein